MTPVSLAFERLGSGPALLFLHGLFGSGRNWRSFALRLADHFTCLLVHLRGHGASPHAPPYDYPTFAADVAALIEREALAPAHLLGHSMGGKTAMVLALTRPELVGRPVVADIAPVPYTHDHRGLIRALRALDLSLIRSRREAEAALAPAVPDPQLRAFLLQNLVIEAEGARWRIDLPGLERAMPALLDFPRELYGRRFEGPTLFVRGGRSDYVRGEHLPVIRRLFPKARIETIPDAHHWLHAERPAELLELVRAFLLTDA